MITEYQKGYTAGITDATEGVIMKMQKFLKEFDSQSKKDETLPLGVCLEPRSKNGGRRLQRKMPVDTETHSDAKSIEEQTYKTSQALMKEALEVSNGDEKKAIKLMFSDWKPSYKYLNGVKSTKEAPKTLEDLEEKEVKGYEGLVFKSDIKIEAMNWVKMNNGDMNIADWIEFFDIEQEFADECLPGNAQDTKRICIKCGKDCEEYGWCPDCKCCEDCMGECKKNTKNEMYTQGWKIGWDKAVKEIERRITQQDVYNSHVGFAWGKVREMLYSDENDLDDTKSAPKGCGTITRTPNGFGIACGEGIEGVQHQYLCDKCQQQNAKNIKNKINKMLKYPKEKGCGKEIKRNTFRCGEEYEGYVVVLCPECQQSSKNEPKVKEIAKMMEMSKIDNKFCADMLRSLSEFTLEDGSLPFATPDYLYLEECISYLDGKEVPTTQEDCTKEQIKQEIDKDYEKD